MAHTVSWLLPDRIIYARTEGDFSLGNFQSLMTDVAALREVGVPLVHVIIDTREVDNVTTNLRDLQKLFQGMPASDKRGWTMIVVTNRLFKFFGSLVTQFANIRYRQNDTPDAAFDFLIEHDDSLPPDLTFQEAFTQMQARANV